MEAAGFIPQPKEYAGFQWYGVKRTVLIAPGWGAGGAEAGKFARLRGGRKRRRAGQCALLFLEQVGFLRYATTRRHAWCRPFHLPLLSRDNSQSRPAAAGHLLVDAVVACSGRRLRALVRLGGGESWKGVAKVPRYSSPKAVRPSTRSHTASLKYEGGFLLTVRVRGGLGFGFGSRV